MNLYKLVLIQKTETERPSGKLKLKWLNKPASAWENQKPEHTQDSQPVVDGDDDDVAVTGQDAAINHVPSSLHEGASMDVNHDWLQPVLIMDIWGKKTAAEKISCNVDSNLQNQLNNG